MQVERFFVQLNGVRLCCFDFGGRGQPILLLHGLAGRATEWRETAEWLTSLCHVLAIDLRGHGQSDKHLGDYSRDAYVNDAIQVIEQLEPGPMALIGQSMGGVTAYLVASRRPDLVPALIVVEAGVSPDPDITMTIETWLASWPVPFPTLAQARAFLSAQGLRGDVWQEVLEERPDGWWPLFEPGEMVASVVDLAATNYSGEWSEVQCPALVVAGRHGSAPKEDLRAMADGLVHARYVEVAGAGHDVHLENPTAWQLLVTEFLDSIR